MSNRETRRSERRHLPRAARVTELPNRPAPRERRSRGRLFGLLAAGFVAVALVLGSFTIVPPLVGVDPTATLVSRMRERGVTIERLDAAAIEALATAKSPTELLSTAAKEVGDLTPSIERVLVTARDPNPAPGMAPVVYNRDPAYVYTFTAKPEAPINFGGRIYLVVVILVNPFTGDPLIGAGFNEQLPVSPSPSPSASPSATPTP